MINNCLHCNKEFKTYPAILKSGNGKFCSRNCCDEHKKNRIIRKCLICHKKFSPQSLSLVKSGGGKYCSQKCQWISQKKGEIKKCLICQKEFYATPKSIRKGYGKYCSVDCQSKGVSGEKSNWWKGGISPINRRIRSSSKFRLWREVVFKRDNWTCQECGRRGIELHPHHIKPFSVFPELRFMVNNGITLCNYCHRKTDSWGVKPN